MLYTLTGIRMTNADDGLLEWFEGWFEKQCDDTWEHDKGVSIVSCDNPGWIVSVDLRSEQADRVLRTIGEPPNEHNGNVGGKVWMVCSVTARRFVGAGDPRQLTNILRELKMLVEPRRPRFGQNSEA